MANQPHRLLYDDVSNTTGATQKFQRLHDDTGVVKIDWHPNTPGPVSVRVEGRVTPAGSLSPDEPWVTLATASEAELTTAGGSFFEQILILPMMRVVVTGTGDAADRVRVWLMQ